jgi:hypothetical protein
MQNTLHCVRGTKGADLDEIMALLAMFLPSQSSSRTAGSSQVVIKPHIYVYCWLGGSRKAAW